MLIEQLLDDPGRNRPDAKSCSTRLKATFTGKACRLGLFIMEL